MSRARDLWHDKRRRKTARHPDRGGNKDARRWLAVWIDPDGREKTRAFATQDAARKYAAKMEADAERGEYIDPKAGRELFAAVAAKYVRLRQVGGASRVRYESVLRNHVDPYFGGRPVKGIRPSEVAEWLSGPMAAKGSAIREMAFLIVSGTFGLAVADGMRRDNPAKSGAVTRPSGQGRRREAWTAARVQKVIDEHPGEYRAIPATAAALGLRQGCAFGLAEEDIDFGAGKVVIRRQVARIGGLWVFKLPKGEKERVVPLPGGLARILEAHIRACPPHPYTLPWMDENGEIAGEHACALLFRWLGGDPRTSGRHIAASSYDQGVWKPALARAGIVPPPVKTPSGTLRYRGGDRDDGMHALRHFYSTTLLDAGVSLAGVMEFMGHSRKKAPVTLGVYGHVTEETFAQARSAVDRKLFGLHSVGTVTELRSAR